MKCRVLVRVNTSQLLIHKEIHSYENKQRNEDEKREEIEARINRIPQIGLIEVIASKLLLEVLLDIRELLDERNKFRRATVNPE